MEREVIADRYELRDELGRGGMATVYVAWDKRLHREVAIKVLTRAHTRRQEEARYLFHREARAAAGLAHDAIVRIFDYSGPEESPPYIVMELIQGDSLHSLMTKYCPLTEPLVVGIAHRVASALAHAHESGVIHRDVKPENVLVTPTGRVLLTDFGLAKAYLDSSRLGKTMAERATSLYGTAEYMAPEQVLAKVSGPESDVFSLGSTIYASAVGRSPFPAATPMLVMQKIVDVEYEPLDEARTGISGPLREMVNQALQREAEDRPSAADMAQRSYEWLCRSGRADVSAMISDFMASPAPGRTGDTEPLDATVEDARRTTERELRPPPGFVATTEVAKAGAIKPVVVKPFVRQVSTGQGSSRPFVTPPDATTELVPLRRRTRWPLIILLGLLVGAGFGLAVLRGWIPGLGP